MGFLLFKLMINNKSTMVRQKKKLLSGDKKSPANAELLYQLIFSFTWFLFR